MLSSGAGTKSRAPKNLTSSAAVLEVCGNVTTNETPCLAALQCQITIVVPLYCYKALCKFTAGIWRCSWRDPLLLVPETSVDRKPLRSSLTGSIDCALLLSGQPEELSFQILVSSTVVEGGPELGMRGNRQLGASDATPSASCSGAFPFDRLDDHDDAKSKKHSGEGR